MVKMEKKTFFSKISPIIFFMIGYYLRLSKAKIARIYKNWFKLKNFYKFYYLKGRKNKDKDENIIFEYGQIKIKKIIGTFCEFRNTIDIWSDGFLNYVIVKVDFFGVIFIFLFKSLLIFHSKV